MSNHYDASSTQAFVGVTTTTDTTQTHTNISIPTQTPTARPGATVGFDLNPELGLLTHIKFCGTALLTFPYNPQVTPMFDTTTYSGPEGQGWGSVDIAKRPWGGLSTFSGVAEGAQTGNLNNALREPYSKFRVAKYAYTPHQGLQGLLADAGTDPRVPLAYMTAPSYKFFGLAACSTPDYELDLPTNVGWPNMLQSCRITAFDGTVIDTYTKNQGWDSIHSLRCPTMETAALRSYDIDNATNLFQFSTLDPSFYMPTGINDTRRATSFTINKPVADDPDTWTITFQKPFSMPLPLPSADKTSTYPIKWMSGGRPLRLEFVLDTKNIFSSESVNYSSHLDFMRDSRVCVADLSALAISEVGAIETETVTPGLHNSKAMLPTILDARILPVKDGRDYTDTEDQQDFIDNVMDMATVKDNLAALNTVLPVGYPYGNEGIEGFPSLNFTGSPPGTEGCALAVIVKRLILDTDDLNAVLGPMLKEGNPLQYVADWSTHPTKVWRPNFPTCQFLNSGFTAHCSLRRLDAPDVSSNDIDLGGGPENESTGGLTHDDLSGTERVCGKRLLRPRYYAMNVHASEISSIYLGQRITGVSSAEVNSKEQLDTLHAAARLSYPLREDTYMDKGHVVIEFSHPKTMYLPIEAADYSNMTVYENVDGDSLVLRMERVGASWLLATAGGISVDQMKAGQTEPAQPIPLGTDVQLHPYLANFGIQVDIVTSSFSYWGKDDNMERPTELYGGCQEQIFWQEIEGNQVVNNPMLKPNNGSAALNLGYSDYDSLTGDYSTFNATTKAGTNIWATQTANMAINTVSTDDMHVGLMNVPGKLWPPISPGSCPVSISPTTIEYRDLRLEANKISVPANLEKELDDQYSDPSAEGGIIMTYPSVSTEQWPARLGANRQVFTTNVVNPYALRFQVTTADTSVKNFQPGMSFTRFSQFQLMQGGEQTLYIPEILLAQNAGCLWPDCKRPKFNNTGSSVNMCGFLKGQGGNEYFQRKTEICYGNMFRKTDPISGLGATIVKMSYPNRVRMHWDVWYGLNTRGGAASLPPNAPFQIAFDIVNAMESANVFPINITAGFGLGTNTQTAQVVNVVPDQTVIACLNYSLNQTYAPCKFVTPRQLQLDYPTKAVANDNMAHPLPGFHTYAPGLPAPPLQMGFPSINISIGHKQLAGDSNYKDLFPNSESSADVDGWQPDFNRFLNRAKIFKGFVEWNTAEGNVHYAGGVPHRYVAVRSPAAVMGFQQWDDSVLVGSDNQNPPLQIRLITYFRQRLTFRANTLSTGSGVQVGVNVPQIQKFS
jgi:hypothetical protein